MQKCLLVCAEKHRMKNDSLHKKNDTIFCHEVHRIMLQFFLLSFDFVSD